MPDITMCPNSDEGPKCPRRNDCYRFRAIPGKFTQSYFATPPFDPETGECEHFDPIGGRTNIQSWEA